MVADTLPDGDERLVLNAEVTRVEYGCAGVTVRTGDGRAFGASQVISTLPLGVLQRRHQQIFAPPLPEKHRHVLESDGVAMGNLTHVVVQFPHVWWNDRLFKWLSANAADGPGARRAASGEFSLWHNLNHRSLLPGSQTLLSFLGDPQSSKYEGMTDAEAQAAVMRRLRAQHPAVEVPEPSAFFISRHGYDRNTHGAYSFFQPGWRDKFFEALTQPLKAAGCGGGGGETVEVEETGEEAREEAGEEAEGRKKKHEVRVRFAGEAMCDDLSGYTHGGYQSGREAAAAYLHEVGKGPDPRKHDELSLCNW
eukprot:Transcript_18364.p1 GENE.Transcript_18364~~Transcript_18364.p1  ORF type:complete len:308 (+),score=138.16 Transcript_18364:748-1671(+)